MSYYPKDLKQKFDDLKFALEEENRKSISLKANGGNTILFIYDPKDERYYLDKLKEEYSDQSVINVADIFVEFIDELGWNNFEELIKEMNQDSYQVFKSQSHEKDFYNKLINKIIESVNSNKIPFLVRVGALHGTSIDNHMIMEDKRIRELKLPLVICYPGVMKDDNLYFLNIKLASKYRSLIIQ